ncbi:MAG: GGDEF domain-containing protein, partial [Candidatus Acidiferrales bacterium]
TDLAARWGGDEFMVLLMECPRENVPVFLDRLGTIEVEIEGRLMPLGLATGCATYQKGDTPEAITERADKSLYARKRDPQAKTPVVAARLT